MNTGLFREPRKSKYDRISVGFGLLTLALSTAGIVVEEFLLVGSAFVLMGGAELLSVDQRRLSALLRVVAIGAFVTFGVAFILTL